MQGIPIIQVRELVFALPNVLLLLMFFCGNSLQYAGGP